MGTLIAIEGIDGAGKNTLATALRAQWDNAGVSSAGLAFPRYGESIHADIAAEALRGAHGDLRASVYAMGVLFALDRAGARDEIAALLTSHDVVLLDRYVGSSAAFSAARLGEGADGAAAEWVADFEFGRLALPRPDVTLFLDTSAGLAAARASSRELIDESRTRDAYERDRELQVRTAQVYGQLATMSWQGPWRVLTPDVAVPGLAVELAAADS